MTSATDNRTTELLPCPFCGGEATVTEFNQGCIISCENDAKAWINGKDDVDGHLAHIQSRSKVEAIAAWNTRATGGTLTAEQVREAIEENSWAETSSIREFNDSSWQAIADELNARAERTCECDSTLYWDMGFGDPYYEHELSCGHTIKAFDKEPPRYCPECGAKVVDA